MTHQEKCELRKQKLRAQYGNTSKVLFNKETMTPKENQSAVDFIEKSFFTEANIYDGFSEDDRWTISENDFMRIIIDSRKLEADILTAMYEKGKSDGYDFATKEAQKEINKIREL